MKQFFKTFLAVLLAMIALPLILFFVLAGTLSSSLESEPVVVEEGSVLVMNLDENIADSPRMPTLSSASLSSMEVVKTLSMLDVMNTLEAAAKDDRIKALYLNFTGTGAIEGTADFSLRLQQFLRILRMSGAA